MREIICKYLSKKRIKVLLFAIVIGSAFLVSRYILSIVIVPTSSMVPTISTGNRVLLNRLAYLNDNPENGDIIAFYHNGRIYIKRVIGCPNQIVEFIGGLVYIDGQEETIKPNSCSKINSDFGTYKVPNDGYFVLGDNRDNSDDSRFWYIPWVRKEDIIGKVIFNLSKFEKM